ncbi:hypothetical protein RUM43_013334 [Polyplax serrata]|uniref:Uncharacterized protein n=1 Tax=Polyplax serrata TaxID=468196 RepID=A0AAN8S704_POLSC
MLDLPKDQKGNDTYTTIVNKSRKETRHLNKMKGKAENPQPVERMLAIKATLSGPLIKDPFIHL